MTDLDKIQSEIKRIGIECRSGLDFVFRLLSAYDVPKATIARLEKSRSPASLSSFSVGRMLYCHLTHKQNLYSEFDLLKKDGLNRIKARFIFLANDDYVLVYDTATEETLSSSKKNLYRQFDFFFPLIGRKKVDHVPITSVDMKAAEKFAQLYNQLLMDNEDIADSDRSSLNILMARLLFCFFADSVGIIPKGTVHKLISSFSDESGEDLGHLVENMFRVMSGRKMNDTPHYLTELPTVEGALFSEYVEPPKFRRQTRRIVLDISKLDWSSINPDILGSLIQSIVIPDTCTGLSNHFTSVPNINKVIGPLFLDELYEALENIQGDCEKLMDLYDRISRIRILDPACGSGNFLIVAYKELKLLESRVIQSIQETTEGKKGLPSRLSLAQFCGIERNGFACEVAKLGLFFTECQLFLADNDTQDLKHAIQHLNLQNIVNANPTRVSWEQLCPNDGTETYIAGNPSYKGARKQSQDQKEDVAYVFRGYSKTKDLDYAACWFFLACDYIANSKNAFAFVTTNSLTQGQQVGLLWPKLFQKDVHISFAHTSFKWKNSGKDNTGVTVVIIGIKSNQSPSKKVIYTQTTSSEVPSINPYLTSAGNVIVRQRTTPISNLPHMPKGNMPYDGGHLLLSPSEKAELVNAYPASQQFLKRVMGSDEFIKGRERWCIWISDSDLENALSIPPIEERINRVREMRLKSSDSAAHKLADRPHQFREINVTTSQSLIIPSVSSERRVYIPIGFVNNSTIITNLAFAVYNCEPWVFGVVASRIHNVWFRAVCGGLETRLRYSSRLGYNTFPFPDISEEQKNSITECVYDVLEERENDVGKSMAQMYDPDTMSDGLLNAHRILDAAVESCYREEPFQSDQERLEFLFQEYKGLI